MNARRLTILVSLLLAVSTGAAAQDWQPIQLDESRLGVVGDSVGLIQSIDHIKFSVAGVDIYREAWLLDDGLMYYEVSDIGGEFSKREIAQALSEVLRLAFVDKTLAPRDIGQAGDLHFADRVTGDQRCIAFLRQFDRSGGGGESTSAYGMICDTPPQSDRLGELVVRFLGSLEADDRKLFDDRELLSLATQSAR